VQVTIYHNPRCSKSRQTLKLLQERGIQPRIVEYLKNPPTREELENILKLLDMEPRALMRKGEPEFKENDLGNPALKRQQLLDFMLEYPKLIERPIVLINGKAALGRPPENVLKIL
jgi:arsenate reductase